MISCATLISSALEVIFLTPHDSYIISAALGIVASVNGDTDISVASTFEKVGMIQFRAGNLESGRKALEKAVEIYRKGDGNESNMITPLFIIGNIHKVLQQEKKAKRVWKEAYELGQKDGVTIDPKVQQILTALLKTNEE